MGSPSANTDISAYTNFQNQNIITYSSTSPDKVRYAALPLQPVTPGQRWRERVHGLLDHHGQTTATSSSAVSIPSTIPVSPYPSALLRTDATTSLVVKPVPTASFTPADGSATRHEQPMDENDPSGTIQPLRIYIRFRKSAANTTQFRIDDISLSGTASR